MILILIPIDYRLGTRHHLDKNYLLINKFHRYYFFLNNLEYLNLDLNHPNSLCKNIYIKMSNQILDPNLDTPDDIDGQLNFFFDKFTLFLDQFKKVYGLKRIEIFINKIYRIVKTFIKNDFFKIPLNIKGKSGQIDYLLKKYGNNNNDQDEIDIETKSAQVLRMIKKANRLRDLSFSELAASPYDNFLLNTQNRKSSSARKEKLKKCIDKLNDKS